MYILSKAFNGVGLDCPCLEKPTIYDSKEEATNAMIELLKIKAYIVRESLSSWYDYDLVSVEDGHFKLSGQYDDDHAWVEYFNCIFYYEIFEL